MSVFPWSAVREGVVRAGMIDFLSPFSFISVWGARENLGALLKSTADSVGNRFMHAACRAGSPERGDQMAPANQADEPSSW